MSINAFVGHSFVKSDTELVRRFLDFFDTVSRMDIDFHWDHAEVAEPKDLSKKVIEKMEEKNLFRGMDIIILLENGVATPGGLQGNIEYIPFVRNNPEESFNKILQMLNSLGKLPVSKVVSESSKTSNPIAETETPHLINLQKINLYPNGRLMIMG